MSRSARPITRLARYFTGEAALPARVRVLLSRERLGEGSADSASLGSSSGDNGAGLLSPVQGLAPAITL